MPAVPRTAPGSMPEKAPAAGPFLVACLAIRDTCPILFFQKTDPRDDTAIRTLTHV